MTTTHDDDVMKSSGKGTALSDATYLNAHYEATKEMYEETMRYVGFQQGWSVLDAGAGGGSFIPLISKLLGPGGKITALDLDAENVAMIERRREAGGFSCPTEAKVGGVTELPFDDNTFDAIWCSAVQQYLSDDEVAVMLDEFNRVVRVGGLICVKDYDESGSVFGMDMARSIRRAEAVTSIPDFAKQANGFRRIIQFPKLFAQHGIEPIHYKTFVTDHRYPVPAEGRPFLESITQTIGWLSSQVNLPNDDMAYWSRWAGPEVDDYILDSPDYYAREAHGVAIGRKPA